MMPPQGAPPTRNFKPAPSPHVPRAVLAASDFGNKYFSVGIGHLDHGTFEPGLIYCWCCPSLPQFCRTRIGEEKVSGVKLAIWVVFDCHGTCSRPSALAVSSEQVD